MKPIHINTTTSKSHHTVLTIFKIKFIIALLLLILCYGDFYPILSAKNINFVAYTFLNHTYSIVCHQSDQKLIFIDGNHSFLCVRCTGIYLGALFVAVSLLMINLNRKISIKPLVIVSSILLLDVLFVNVDLYNYTIWLTFTSGFLFGAVIFIYIVQVIEEVVDSTMVENFDK